MVSLNFMILADENQVEADLVQSRRFQCSEIKVAGQGSKQVRDQF